MPPSKLSQANQFSIEGVQNSSVADGTVVKGPSGRWGRRDASRLDGRPLSGLWEIGQPANRPATGAAHARVQKLIFNSDCCRGKYFVCAERTS